MVAPSTTVSPISGSDRNPGYNKARPKKTNFEKAHETEKKTIAAATVIQIPVEIDDYKEEKKQEKLPQVKVFTNEAKPAEGFTNKFKELLDANTSEQVYAELTKLMSLSDVGLLEALTQLLTHKNSDPSELLDMQMKYDQLKTNLNEILKSNQSELDRYKTTVTTIKNLVSRGFDLQDELCKSPIAKKDVLHYIEQNKNLFEKMDEILSNDEKENAKEEIQVSMHSNVDAEVSRDAKRKSFEIGDNENLSTHMIAQSADIETLDGSLDVTLDKFEGKFNDSEFITQTNVILKTLEGYVKTMVKNKKTLDEQLPLLQKQINEGMISNFTNKELQELEKVSPNGTTFDLEKKIEEHRCKNLDILHYLEDLLTRYAKSYTKCLKIIQKINTRLTDEQLESNDVQDVINTIHSIKSTLKALALDFDNIVIRDIRYKILTSLFNEITQDVVSSESKFRGFRKSYSENNKIDTPALEKKLNKNILEFTYIESRWNIIAPYILKMITELQEEVKLGQFSGEISDRELARFAVIRKISKQEIKKEIAVFEENHNRKNAIVIDLISSYKMLSEKTSSVKKELRRLDLAILSYGKFCTETYYDRFTTATNTSEEKKILEIFSELSKVDFS